MTNIGSFDQIWKVGNEEQVQPISRKTRQQKGQKGGREWVQSVRTNHDGCKSLSKINVSDPTYVQEIHYFNLFVSIMRSKYTLKDVFH